MRFLALSLLLSGFAAAQLQVTVPAAAACTPGQTPVPGILVHSNMGGSYGYELGQDLRDALEMKGFLVVREYSTNTEERATIGIKGQANYWKSRSGEQSASKIGDVRLVLYNVSNDSIIANVEQKPANLAFNAPNSQAFLDSLVSIFTKNFCQIQQ